MLLGCSGDENFILQRMKCSILLFSSAMEFCKVEKTLNAELQTQQNRMCQLVSELFETLKEIPNGCLLSGLDHDKETSAFPKAPRQLAKQENSREMLYRDSNAKDSIEWISLFILLRLLHGSKIYTITYVELSHSQCRHSNSTKYVSHRHCNVSSVVAIQTPKVPKSLSSQQIT
jgi:hypothetical protein